MATPPKKYQPLQDIAVKRFISFLLCFYIASFLMDQRLLSSTMETSRSIQVVSEEDFYRFLIPPYFIGTVIICNQKYNIPFKIIYRLGLAESKWRKYPEDGINKTSYDVGPWQLNSKYFSYFRENFYKGRKQDFNPRNPLLNVEIGMAYLHALYHQFGSWEKAVLAYNFGPGNVEKGKEPPKKSKEYVNFILDETVYDL